jgi:hypothetical protein
MTRVGPLRQTKKKSVPYVKINSLVFVMETPWVLCEVETEFVSCTM